MLDVDKRKNQPKKGRLFWKTSIREEQKENTVVSQDAIVKIATS